MIEKKVFLMIFILALALFQIVSALEQNITYDTSETSGGYVLTSYNIEPYPIEPNERFTVYPIIKNVQTSPFSVTCKIDEKFPFSVYGKNIQNTGVQESGREYRMEFNILVDAKAQEGIENLIILCSSSITQDVWKAFEIPVRIRQRTSVLNIPSVSQNPEVFPQGKEGTLKLTLDNEAQTAVKDISVQIDFSTTDIAPANGITQRKIQTLPGKSTSEIVFSIIPLPDIEAGLYKLPLTVTYSDSQGSDQSYETLISLKIGEKPKYKIIPLTYARAGWGKYEISLKIINDGLADLQFFTINIPESSEIKVFSGRMIYVGELGSDDYLTESFTAKLPSSNFNLPVEVSYADKLNREFKETINIPINYSQMKNTSKSGWLNWIILFLLLSAVAYFIYKKRHS